MKKTLKDFGVTLGTILLMVVFGIPCMTIALLCLLVWPINKPLLITCGKPISDILNCSGAVFLMVILGIPCMIIAWAWALVYPHK